MNDPLLSPDDFNEAALPASLRALPEIAPSEDRLALVLAQAAAQRANRSKGSPTKPKKQAPQRWFVAFAATLCALALLSRIDVRGPQPPQAGSEITPMSPEQSEIALLRWQSQALERQMQSLRDDRASLSQLDALSVAELSIAALDAQLQGDHRPSSEDLMSQQRALWRERVAVLQAVNQGHYQPTLYAID